jgi:transposase
MSKTFRAWKIDEPLFLPPMVGDFVAKDHLACFVLSLVRDDLGLGEITGTYGSERGQPPFDPTMMTALLLYSYCRGIYSSRRIAKACRLLRRLGAAVSPPHGDVRRAPTQ